MTSRLLKSRPITALNLLKEIRSERRTLGLGLALAFSGWLASDVARADEESIPRLVARPVAARPLPVPEADRQVAPAPVHRDDAVKQTALQEGSDLQWQRRSDVGNDSGFSAPRNSRTPRIAAADPINDPFGDRSDAAAPSFNAPPADMPRNESYAAPISERRYYQERTQNEAFDCQAFYDRLASNRLDQIVLTVSPSGAPDALTAEQYRADVLSKVSKAKVIDWVDRSGRVIARGKMQDWVNGQILIVTEEGQPASIAYDDLSAASRAEVIEIWRIPTECSLPGIGPVDRMWGMQTYTWTASALCHKPLFFEDVQLERYGQTSRPVVQGFKSGAHFFLNIAAMPYNAGVYPPNECRYALGYYRPGDCAPYLGKSLPLSVRGAMWQAGAVVGGAAALP